YAPRNPALQGGIARWNSQRIASVASNSCSPTRSSRLYRKRQFVPAHLKILSLGRKERNGPAKHDFRRDVWYDVLAVLCSLLRLRGSGAHDHRHQDQHTERLARLDPHRQHHPDAQHRTKADLVDHSVPDPTGQHRDDYHRLDGGCRGAAQTELVGHFDDRARSQPYRPRLSCLGRLSRRAIRIAVHAFCPCYPCASAKYFFDV